MVVVTFLSVFKVPFLGQAIRALNGDYGLLGFLIFSTVCFYFLGRLNSFCCISDPVSGNKTFYYDYFILNAFCNLLTKYQNIKQVYNFRLGSSYFGV